MYNAGDAVMYRIYYHIQGYSDHLSEQLDKNTGQETSAYDLTWSYANVMVALKTRESFSGVSYAVDENLIQSFLRKQFEKLI